MHRKTVYLTKACVLLGLAHALTLSPKVNAQTRLVADYPATSPSSSWDDLVEGVATPEDWAVRRELLKTRYLDLLRDDQKPERPPLDVEIHETELVDGKYERRLISYRVEGTERAHAYVGLPCDLQGKAPGIVALHGTNPKGIEALAGLSGEPEKAFLDHLCRRGFVVIAPEHFVSGRRTPPEGPYETARFYAKHPEWTAVGKFTYEHSIAIDVLAGIDEVDSDRIGVIGHSLGGHGALFLAAYDDRIRAAACNCGASFFRHNARVADWARDRWYVYFKHMRAGLERGQLPPIDFHEIAALIAPRAFLDVCALNDGDAATQRQRLLMMASVMRVYDVLKSPDNLAFFVHGHGHKVPAESHAMLYGWLEAKLKPDAHE